MSHVLAVAAEVIGVVAIGVATAASGGLGAGALAFVGHVAASVGLASATALAGALSAAAAVASIGSQVLAKAPAPITNPMTWQSDPLAGIPLIMGQAYSGGNITFRQTWAKDNKTETIQTVYSCGPIKAFNQFYVDGVAVGVAADGAVAITDRGKMYVGTQRGQQPEAVQFGGLDIPGITATSKLSGLAASSITLYYDAKGSVTFVTEPQTGYLLEGPTVYDPRKDDTQSGGSGPQRWNDETTWSYVGFDNPYLQAITWLIGRRQNGKLMMGVGVPLKAIIVAQFIEGANVADVNCWKIGGEISSTDDKYDRLTDILQAGGGEPIFLGAQIGCLVNTPKVSLATINEGDVIGAASVQATQPRRSRINAIVPRFMAEQTETTEDNDGDLVTTVTWGMLAGDPVTVPDYETFDGGLRLTQVDYPFVQCRAGQSPTQAVQLARYDIENAREFGPITLPLKLRFMGYRPGDCVTANLPSRGLVNQDILLLQRGLSAQNATVTMTARSETSAKHAFALGQTSTPPPTPSLSGAPLVPIPGPAAWALYGVTIASDNGTTQSGLQVLGSADSDVIDAVMVQYRLSQTESAPAGAWSTGIFYQPSVAEIDISGIRDLTSYDVAISYRMGVNIGSPLILGPAVAGQTSVPYQTGVTGPKPPVDADSTTAVFVAAGRSVDQVISDLDAASLAGVNNALSVEQEAAARAAATFMADQPIATYLQDFVTQQTSATTALVTKLSIIGAETADGKGWLFNMGSVQVAPGQTLAEKFEEVGVTNGIISAKVDTLAEAYLNEDGTAKALYTVSLTAIGSSGQKVVGGFTDLVSGDGTSDFAIVATTFKIVSVDGDTVHVPFQIADDGTVYMTSVVVDTIKVGSGYTSGVPVFSARSDTVNGSGSGTYSNVITMTVTLSGQGTILADCFAAQGFPDGDATWNARLVIDGTTVFATGGEKGADSISLGGAVTKPAGTYTVSLSWAADSSARIANRCLRAWVQYGS